MSQPGIGSSAFGAKAVHLAIAELLRRGHRVAVPVVDDDGVDLVVDYRVTVQVKSASLRVARPVLGYSYPAFKWFLGTKRRTADVFLLHAAGDERDRWFVVRGDVVRMVKSTVTIYDGMSPPGGSGRQTLGGMCLAGEAHWELFDELTCCVRREELMCR